MDGGLGISDLKNKFIGINETLPDEVLQATLLHEVIHCIDYTMPHNQVEMLSNSLAAFLKDNQKLKNLFFPD